MSEKEDKEDISLDISYWTFCPSCGTKLPKIEKQKFCIKCGTDLQYIKDNVVTSKLTLSDNTYHSYQKDLGSIKIADEDILNLGEKKIWNSKISIGIPILAFIIMNLLATIIVSFFLASLLNIEELINLLENPYFIIIISLMEVIFMIVPVYYVGKYLQNPSLKNRFSLLGLTTKGYSSLGIVKEILIGLGFAVLGILLVLVVSIFIEIIVEVIFNIDIVYSSGSSLGDIDTILLNSDLTALILLVITMVFVIGFAEEISFRGFMQRGLTRTIGIKGGIIITALVFSLIHIIGIFIIPEGSPITYLISFLLYFFPYFAISLLLGLLFYWRKENLIAVIITHGFYDALTIIIAFIYLSSI